MSVKKIFYPLSIGVPTAQVNAMSTLQTLLCLMSKTNEVIDVLNGLGLQPISEWVSPAWTNDASYEQGDYVSKGGLLYVAVENVVAGSGWNEDSWSRVLLTNIDKTIALGLSTLNGTVNGLIQTEAEHYGEVMGRANGAYGETGTVVLEFSEWVNKQQTLTFSGLGDNDAILFWGSTRAEKEKITEADIFSTANGTSVTFSCETVPVSDITLKFVICRGQRE